MLALFTVYWINFRGVQQEQTGVKGSELGQFIEDMMLIDLATDFNFMIE